MKPCYRGWLVLVSDVAPGGTGDLSTEGGMTRTSHGGCTGCTSTGHTADMFAGHLMDTCGHLTVINN